MQLTLISQKRMSSNFSNITTLLITIWKIEIVSYKICEKKVSWKFTVNNNLMENMGQQKKGVCSYITHESTWPVEEIKKQIFTSKLWGQMIIFVVNYCWTWQQFNINVSWNSMKLFSQHVLLSIETLFRKHLQTLQMTVSLYDEATEPFSLIVKVALTDFWHGGDVLHMLCNLKYMFICRYFNNVQNHLTFCICYCIYLYKQGKSFWKWSFWINYICNTY